MNTAETRRSSSADPDEVRHFASLADEWWNERGKFKGLHAFNPARLQFIVEAARNHRTDRGARFRALEGLSVLDIGCGGGILSEPLARLGGRVTGIDPVPQAVEVAKAHALQSGLAIDYRNVLVEDLAPDGQAFDLVIASEVIEHVPDPLAFLKACRQVTVPDGLLVVSTLNRTAKSYALAIVAAERFLGLIPKGTHDWNKFIKPDELDAMLTDAGFEPRARAGLVLNPLAGGWSVSGTDLSINYIAAAVARTSA